MAKKKKKLSERATKQLITNLVKRHGKVRILFHDASDYTEQQQCDCMCKSCKRFFRGEGYLGDVDQRRRVITKDGDCVVSYKSDGHTRWSGYDQSCFMSDYHSWHYDEEKEYSVKETLKIMFDHDRGDIIPVMIEFGKRFSRKIKL